MIYYLIAACGLVYSIIGIITYFTLTSEKNITHLPAWFRRTIDGLFILFFCFYVRKHPNKRPWRGWFKNEWILLYALISLLIHYGGMLPPIYLYDRVPIFNKLTHVNASIVILFLLSYGRETDQPRISDFAITLIIGILWEISEYLTTPDHINYWTVIDIGYGWDDTKGDLIANFIGIICAYILSYVKTK